MHTDDQFADTLSQSLRASTADLHYTGPVPTPARPGRLAAPLAAAAAVGLGVLLISSVGSGGSAGSSSTTSSHPTAVAERPTHRVTKMPAAHLVAKTLHVAGRTLHYVQPSGAVPLYALQVDSVPSGAQQVDNDWSVKVYVGVQPGTGYQAAFVVTANGQTLAITSPDSTRSDLLAAVQAPVSAVPSIAG